MKVWFGKGRVGLILARSARKENTLRRWAQALSISATLVWMAVTLFFLGSEDPPSPEAPPWWFPILAHLFLFGVLGFLVQLTLVTLERSSGWLFSLTMVVAIGFLWGLATELYQTTIPTRSASWEDLLWDAAGALLGGTGARLAEISASRYSGWRSLFYP